MDKVDKLKEIKNLLDNGFLSQLEADKMKSEILNELVKPIPQPNIDTSKFVIIEKQIWMNENLNIGKFRNGDVIPEVKSDDEWLKCHHNKSPAWCYYKNDPKYGEKYGKLYNWYAVNDPRGLAPKGWHVPSVLEFEALISTIHKEGEAIDGDLKSVGLGYGCNKGTNESGFSWLAGGLRHCTYEQGARYKDYIFVFEGTSGDIWTSSEFNLDCAAVFSFSKKYIVIKGVGHYVRCLWDYNVIS